MNALGTVNDGEFERMLKASKALKIKVNRDKFPKSPVIVWKLQGKDFITSCFKQQSSWCYLSGCL